MRSGLRRLSLHSKLVLLFTTILIFGGALGIFLLERNNPATLQGEPLPKQALMSMFQSVTLRTRKFPFSSTSIAIRALPTATILIATTPSALRTVSWDRVLPNLR